MIETFTFRLLEGAEEAAFLAVDKRLQSDFAYQQAGLVRRTTARSADGEWIVIDLWWSPEEADACAARWETDRLAQEFMSFVDPATVKLTRYVDLE